MGIIAVYNLLQLVHKTTIQLPSNMKLVGSCLSLILYFLLINDIVAAAKEDDPDLTKYHSIDACEI